MAQEKPEVSNGSLFAIGVATLLAALLFGVLVIGGMQDLSPTELRARASHLAGRYRVLDVEVRDDGTVALLGELIAPLNERQARGVMGSGALLSQFNFRPGHPDNPQLAKAKKRIIELASTQEPVVAVSAGDHPTPEDRLRLTGPPHAAP